MQSCTFYLTLSMQSVTFYLTLSMQSITFYLTLSEMIPELEMTFVERQADIEVQARSVWTASGPSGVDKIYVSDCRHNCQWLQVPLSV